MFCFQQIVWICYHLVTLKKSLLKRIKSCTIKFEPQHPTANKVFRLILKLNGEIVNRRDSHLGVFHRGTKKLIKYKNYTIFY